MGRTSRESSDAPCIGDSEPVHHVDRSSRLAQASRSLPVILEEPLSDSVARPNDEMSGFHSELLLEVLL